MLKQLKKHCGVSEQCAVWSMTRGTLLRPSLTTSVSCKGHRARESWAAWTKTLQSMATKTYLSTDGALLLPVQAGNSSCHFSVPLERYTVKWCRWLCGYFQFNSYLLHLTGTDTLNKLLWYPADLWTRVFVQISCWFTQHHIHKFLHL